MSDTMPASREPAMVSREQTQAKLDARSQRAMLIKPGDRYTIADRLEERAREHGQRPFLIYAGQSLSYAQINARADRFAHAMRAQGLRCGDVCAMALENRIEFFVAWFGLAKLGAVVAPLNTQVHGRPLVHAIQTTAAKLVLVGEECLANFAATEELPATARYLLLPDAENPVAGALPDWLEGSIAAALEAAPQTPFPRDGRAEVSAETQTLLIFTSGTTGLPKAARYSHMRWMSSGDVMEVTINATPEDVFYCCLPLYHGAAATSVTSTALRAGASILLRRRFSVSQFWNDVRRHRVTVWQYIGEICRYVLNREPQPDDREHSLRAMMGAGLIPEIWQRWIERFGEMDVYEGWGSTEANTSLINVDNRIGSCGRVPCWDKTNLRLVRYDVEQDDYLRDGDGHLITCQPGEVGEAIAFIVDHPQVGAGRFEGYTSAEATQSKILRNVFTEGDAYWRSGDLLRCDEDGYCYFVDRIGDTFRWKSENVSTQEVTDALSDFAGAELINIYGVRVPGHEGRAGMAAIVMRDGCEFDPRAFYELTEARVPRYAAPQFVRVCAAADMTSTFKLRKVDMQKQGYDPDAFADPLYLRDDRAGSYRRYSAEALQAAGLPAFR